MRVENMKDKSIKDLTIEDTTHNYIWKHQTANGVQNHLMPCVILDEPNKFGEIKILVFSKKFLGKGSNYKSVRFAVKERIVEKDEVA